MESISIEESLDLFVSTLGLLDNRHLKATDEDLKYIIFEDLDSDSYTFLHSWTVNRLVEGGLIPASIKEDTQTLRDLIQRLLIEKTDVQEIRSDAEWNAARELALNILYKVETHQRQNAKRDL